ncbi:MAG: histidine phosphatase family protein [Candidatus Woesearchaeota archaeon]|jgi:probable phosphoglycerate mutase|nr:histidine phosphatase family protein [Candidatus Woesearchaeota archaeon]MDP7506780.1 histidine phosphatase family protein [Candidatus Woesearchaeota archaeon]|tara:strand:- start:100 stop:570 length:471 start_codon:yes stop_codon:yes gene_type:complete
MKLILTRHGETIENQNKIVQGHLPGKLSKEGIQQAKKLALRLKDEKLDYIYSSDLARAADTAKEILKYHPDTSIEFVEELREGDLGSFTGKNKKDIDWNNRPGDMEPRESMRKRVKKLLDSVYTKHPNATILFVGHNGINKALISVILNKPAEYME